MFIVTLPMAMQTAISMSADCMSLGVTLALISYVLKLIYTPNEKMTKKDYLIVSILSFVLSQCKLVYLPICLITLAIPKTKFNNSKRKYLNLGLIILISVILNLAWLSVARQYISSISGNSSDQLEFILNNPINYFGILINTYVKDFSTYYKMMLGSSLGNLRVFVNNFYIDIDMILAFLLIFLDRKNVKINKKTRYISLFIFLMVVILISTSLYLEWTMHKNKTILGLQGRYFLPIYLLSFLVLDNDLLKVKNNKIFNQFYLLLFMIIENISIISYLFICYRFI